MQKLLPNVPMVAVFDTSFHQTMPEKHLFINCHINIMKITKIRKYGFHGISHRYVAKQNI